MSSHSSGDTPQELPPSGPNELGKYTLMEEIGQGGMATVYRAQDRELGREVAVKVLHPHLAKDQAAKERFHREAQAVARLRHDNIVQIFDYSGRESPQNYIVTEFVRGETLKDFLAKRPAPPPEIAAMIIVEVCHAVDHAHGLGIIHRDVKPENVMIRFDGSVKLMDFGIAQMIELQKMTVTGNLLGSPAYMAPELVEGQPLDERCDVFSLGTVLYQLATSQLPFDGANAHEVLKRVTDGKYVRAGAVNSAVPDRLADIIDKAMARRPADRYQRVKDFLHDLVQFLGEGGLIDTTAEFATYYRDPTAYEVELKSRIIENVTREGQAALRRGERTRALALFDRVLCADPNNQSALAALKRVEQRFWIGRVGIAAAVMAVLLVSGTLVALRIMVKSRERATVAMLHSTSGAPSASGADEHSSVAGDALEGRPASVAKSGEPARRGKADVSASLGRLRRHPSTIGAPTQGDDSAHAASIERTVRIVPIPKAVDIWVNGTRVGAYGPELSTLSLPPYATTVTFRNEACCFEKEVKLGPGDHPDTLFVRLPWKPARLQVKAEPVAEADVVVGSLVARADQVVEVPIPHESADGRTTVVVKVSANGYETYSSRVTLRANTLMPLHVQLRRMP